MPNKACIFYLYFLISSVFTTNSHIALGSTLTGPLKQLNVANLSKVGEVSKELTAYMKKLPSGSYLVTERTPSLLTGRSPFLTTRKAPSGPQYSLRQALYEKTEKGWKKASAVRAEAAQLEGMPSGFQNEFMVVRVAEDNVLKVSGKRFFKNGDQCSTCTFQPAQGGQAASWGTTQNTSSPVWISELRTFKSLLEVQAEDIFRTSKAAGGNVTVTKAAKPSSAAAESQTGGGGWVFVQGEQPISKGLVVPKQRAQGLKP